MTGRFCDDAMVHAIYRVRTHSRACHDLGTRALLIRVERQMMALLLAAQPGSEAGRPTVRLSEEACSD